MLTPANADLVRRDSEILGLRLLLDSEALHAALREIAPGADLRSTKVRYLRYKPGVNCLAAATLNVGGVEVACHAKAYRMADAEKLHKALHRPTVNSPLGPGRFILWSHAIEITTFPNDNKLESLCQWLEPNTRAAWLGRRLGTDIDWSHTSIRVLAYKPERRFVSAICANEKPAVVAKIYSGSTFDQAQDRATRLSRVDGVRLAKVLGISRRRQTLLFEWLSGEVLGDRLLDSALPIFWLSRVGRALASFHRSCPCSKPPELCDPPGGTDKFDPRRHNDLGVIHALADVMTRVSPKLANPIQRIVEALGKGLEAAGRLMCPIHGDFYSKQVLMRDSEIAFIDLDELSMGHPAADLGTFFAHMERDVLCDRLTSRRYEECRDALIAGYEESMPQLSSSILNLFVALKLFSRAPHFLRTCHPEWDRLTQSAMERVHELLAIAWKPAAAKGIPAQRTSGATALEPIAPTAIMLQCLRDTRLPMIRQALDPVSFLGHLKATAPDGSRLKHAQLLYVSVRRHKLGRRCLIEYGFRHECSGEFAVLGKLRARGVDLNNYQFIESLSCKTFATDSSDGISIPPPLAALNGLGMWLQARVSGCSGFVALSGLDAPCVAERIAKAIRKLHNAPLFPSKKYSLDEELRTLQSRLGAVRDELPDLGERIDRVLAACGSLATGLVSCHSATVHRDFYPDQVVVDRDRVHLVDLDLCAQGDPALDAGNFLAHLAEYALRHPERRLVLKSASEAFTGQFLESNDMVNAHAVDVWTTLSLCRHIALSRLWPDRQPYTLAILSLCERRLGIAHSIPVSFTQ